EMDALVGADASLVKLRFGVEPDGNAPQDPQQEFTGKNLLYVANSIEEIATQVGRSAEDVTAALQAARVRLFEARLARPRPHLDDKILTAWKGLMIAAFARMARVSVGPAGPVGTIGHDAAPYLHAAQRAASFIRDRLWRAESQ